MKLSNSLSYRRHAANSIARLSGDEQKVIKMTVFDLQSTRGETRASSAYQLSWQCLQLGWTAV